MVYRQNNSAIKKNAIRKLLVAIFLVSLLVPFRLLHAADSDTKWVQVPAAPSSWVTGNAKQYNGVALSSTSAYFVGSRTKDYGVFAGGSDNQWRIEKRNRATGNVEWALPTASASRGAMTDVATDSSGFWVTGYYKEVIWALFVTVTNENWILYKYPLSPSSGNPTIQGKSMPSSSDVGVFDFSWLFGGSALTGDTGANTIAIDDTGVYTAGLEIDHVTVGIPITDDVGWIVQKNSPVNGARIWQKKFSRTSVFGFPAPTPSNYLMTPTDLAVGGGNLYIAGYLYDGTHSQVQSMVTKINATDPQDSEFSSNTKRNDLGTNGMMNGIVFYNNKIYTAGSNYSFSNNNTDHWIIQKRDPDSLGVQTNVDVDLPSASETLNKIAAGPLGLYVIGKVKNGSIYDWRIEKRNLDTLDLDPIGGWPVVDGFGTAGSDEPLNLAVDNNEIYVAGYQNDKYIRSEVRGDSYSGECKLEFHPVSTPPKNIAEGTSVDYSVGETDASNPTFCNCPQVTINKTYDPDNIVTISPSNPLLNQLIEIKALPNSINSCSEEVRYQASCPAFTPSDEFKVRVIKTCNVSCSPAEQKVYPGQVVSVTGSTDFPGNPFSWSIESGDEFVASSSNPQPDMLQMTINPSVTKGQVQVKVQNCCGSSECKLNIERVGWVEAQ